MQQPEQYIMCPETGCARHEVIHRLTPDTALLNLMIHFMSAHEKRCPFQLLDTIVVQCFSNDHGSTRQGGMTA